MKTLLLTLLAVTLFSCSTDSIENKDCSKGTIIEAQTLSPNGGGLYTAITVKNDCSGKIDYYTKVGIYKVGDKY